MRHKHILSAGLLCSVLLPGVAWSGARTAPRRATTPSRGDVWLGNTVTRLRRPGKTIARLDRLGRYRLPSRFGFRARDTIFDVSARSREGTALSFSTGGGIYAVFVPRGGGQPLLARRGPETTDGLAGARVPRVVSDVLFGEAAEVWKLSPREAKAFARLIRDYAAWHSSKRNQVILMRKLYRGEAEKFRRVADRLDAWGS